MTDLFREKIIQKIQPIFERFITVENFELKEETVLTQVVDSLTMLEIINDVETAFGITVPDEAMPKMIHFIDVINGIEKLIAEKET